MKLKNNKIQTISLQDKSHRLIKKWQMMTLKLIKKL